MLGRKHVLAKEAYTGGYIGVNYHINEDLSGNLTESVKEFNALYIPFLLQIDPERSKISAGLACGAVWTVAQGMNTGDIIISPDGEGNFYVGEVSGSYEYKEGDQLNHRRAMSWYSSPLLKR